MRTESPVEAHNMTDSFTDFIYWFGCFALAYYAYDNLKNPVLLLAYGVAQRMGWWRAQSLRDRYGRWAAITGATDGIGKAYARELAAHGLNIVLISRTATKLANVANEIATDYAVETKTIVADFTHGASVYEHIERELDDLPVAIWVNNVGQFTSMPGNLAHFTAAELTQVLQTNVLPVTLLSRAVLLRMKRMRLHGVIVNVSSVMELLPAPLAATYAASKSYTRSLTIALQHEASPWDIRVQLVSPSFVTTKLSGHADLVRHNNICVPTPARFARWAVATLRTPHIDTTTGYVWHGALNAIIKLFPPPTLPYLWHALAELFCDELKAL